MKILVACEESQRVTVAFREKGHIAFSFDLQDCKDCHVTLAREALELINRQKDIIKKQKAEIERLTEEVKKIKEMTAEQVVESEKLKQSCAEAVNGFIRMETLYKIKCQELEIANKKLEELKGGKTD